MGRGKRTKKRAAIKARATRSNLSGISELDSLFGDFEKEQVYLSECDEDRSVSRWRHCTFENAACHAIAEVFVEFLEEYGISAALSDEVDGEEFVGDPDTLGYADRPIRGAPWHTVPLVYLNDDIYAVDWSAHQYGYTTFPVVSKYSPDGWLREWPTVKVIPQEAHAAAAEMLSQLSGPLSLGDTRVVSGFCIETHTIGCRNHADDPEEEWWDRHFAIYDEYKSDGVSQIVGDPTDGYFATITPARLI